MHIVITDCDHGSIEIEQGVARKAGASLSLKQARTEDQVIEQCGGADGLIVQYAPITERVLAALPTVRAIARYGVGVDTIDLDAATRHGVQVMNIPDYGTEEVADHALTLALATLRGVVELDRRLRRGEYDLTPIQPVPRISRSTFGVVGLGAIGRTVARLARGVGFSVVGYDPYVSDADARARGVEPLALTDLAARSDVISLHVPLNAHTRHLAGTDFFASMKPSAILVNTCRGGVVDTDALVHALTSGEIHGAGLDVFEQEPLPADHPLTRLPNVVLTPHAAWYSGPAYADLKRKVVEHVVAALTSGDAPNVLNRKPLGARR